MVSLVGLIGPSREVILNVPHLSVHNLCTFFFEKCLPTWISPYPHFSWSCLCVCVLKVPYIFCTLAPWQKYSLQIFCPSCFLNLCNISDGIMFRAILVPSCFPPGAVLSLYWHSLSFPSLHILLYMIIFSLRYSNRKVTTLYIFIYPGEQAGTTWMRGLSVRPWKPRWL